MSRLHEDARKAARGAAFSLSVLTSVPPRRPRRPRSRFPRRLRLRRTRAPPRPTGSDEAHRTALGRPHGRSFILAAALRAGSDGWMQDIDASLLVSRLGCMFGGESNCLPGERDPDPPGARRGDARRAGGNALRDGAGGEVRRVPVDSHGHLVPVSSTALASYGQAQADQDEGRAECGVGTEGLAADERACERRHERGHQHLI